MVNGILQADKNNSNELEVIVSDPNRPTRTYAIPDQGTEYEGLTFDPLGVDDSRPPSDDAPTRAACDDD